MRLLSPRILLLATIIATIGAQAATMNKCIVNGSVSYQQNPCPSTKARKDPTLEELNAAEKKREKAPISTAPTTAVLAKEATVASPTVSSSYRCDGRQYCSQMGSCAEAKFFLKNCPGVKMDGNNDGVPCEAQWCDD
ncbi:excalibur calcium-binding domain-containing protein [Aquabacterium sp. A3]|uniref:excalibur calcium-binding domain-containing protein n=1 Tax=Aquabacterium sp. A3 TaxID=3132829 RepID=UPI0031192408